MASFELNPTFTALNPPFCSSYGVVLRCLWIVMALTVDRLWIDCGLTVVAYGVDHGVERVLTMA